MTWLTSYVAEHDLVIIGGGVAGYVAAIKAGQEGLKVHIRLVRTRMMDLTRLSSGSMYREAWRPWRNLLERRLYPIKIAPQQLVHVPPDPARHQKARHRSWRSEAQPETDDGREEHFGGRADEGSRVSVQEKQRRIH